MVEHTYPEFGKVRSYVWPIHRHELPKLLPMFFMLFFVCFNYTILRNLKDTLVITSQNAGAEVIPFIKVWVMLPVAVVSTIIFTYLSNHLSRRKVFYLVISFFLTYFFTFTFFIYPLHESLQANGIAAFLQSILPLGCKGFIAMVRHWPFTMFYVVAELWSTMVLSVLFWGFANEITRISEATRFYSALNIGSNSSSVIAGQVGAVISAAAFNPGFFCGESVWEQTLVKLTLILLCCGLGILATFHWMTKNVLEDPHYVPDEVRHPKKEKKLSFRESLSFIAHSKYLTCIAIIVVSYNLVIHMVEVIWKDRLFELYRNPNDYNIYMNNLTSAMGIISLSTSLVMAGIIRRLGWTKTALITPIVLLITTVLFFSCLLGEKMMVPYVAAPVALAVFLGSVQNCFTKAAKYSLYDTTKEMAFIPLTPEQKLKGKTAIDGIGSRLGKSGGSLIHQGLIILFCSLSSSTPFVAAIILCVIFLWILAVRTLGLSFSEKAEEKQHEEELEEAQVIKVVA